MGYWLIKSEPYKYSWAELLRDGSTSWDGVRNYEARNNLRAMRAGDLALFYHSNEGKEIVGIARIAREAYADPTAQGEDWSVVDVEPVIPFRAPVSLDVIRNDPALSEMALLKRKRLSVVPVDAPHFDHLLDLGKTRLAKAARPKSARVSSPHSRASKASGPKASSPKASRPKPSSPKASRPKTSGLEPPGAKTPASEEAPARSAGDPAKARPARARSQPGSNGAPATDIKPAPAPRTERGAPAKSA